MPVGMPPLTPGTNKKLAEVLKASFETWDKEAQSRNITKGKSIYPINECYSIRFILLNFCQSVDTINCEIPWSIYVFGSIQTNIHFT